MAVELKVAKRNFFGKKAVVLRRQRLIPAELYGRGIENIHLSVAEKDLKNALKEAGENTVVNLKIDLDGQEEERPVLIYDVARHPVSDEIVNVDFYQVRMDEAVETEVPLEFIGESLAVKEKEAVLVKVMQEVEVEALPADIPRSIQVDLSGLVDINQSIYIKDLKVSEKVKILADLESVVVTVKPKTTEEEEKALQEEGVDVSKIEVAGEKKEEEVVEGEAGEKPEEKIEKEEKEGKG